MIINGQFLQWIVNNLRWMSLLFVLEIPTLSVAKALDLKESLEDDLAVAIYTEWLDIET